MERVCFERLRVAHNYISADDLRTWKPQYVVQTVMEMVDPKIATEWQLSIGSEPGDSPTKYIPIGTQKGFDPKYINQLWQAMSSLLHCSVPKSAKQPIVHYRVDDKVKPKIEEALQELDRIAEGTIVGSLVLEQVSFSCVCGQANRRSVKGLTHDTVINCIKEGCKEQYRVEKRDDEFYFERRLEFVNCHKCGTKEGLPYRALHEIERGTRIWFHCRNCGQENTFMWRLMQVKRKEAGRRDSGIGREPQLRHN